MRSALKTCLSALVTLSTVACGDPYALDPVSADSTQNRVYTATSLTCSLSVSPSFVSFPGSTTFEITASEPLPAGATSWWNGTKNGGVDAKDEPTYQTYAVGTFPILYTNPAHAGDYVRYAVIKDKAGNLLCRTNSVAVTLDPPRRVSCSLAASPTDVPPYGTTVLTISATGIRSGDQAFWYGNKNGKPDASGTPTGVASGSFPITNSPGYSGTYDRWAVILDSTGNPLCTTNSVTVQFR